MGQSFTVNPTQTRLLSTISSSSSDQRTPPAVVALSSGSRKRVNGSVGGHEEKSDDEFGVLQDVPRHLRRTTNAETPIFVDDSNSEDDKPGPSIRKRPKLFGRPGSPSPGPNACSPLGTRPLGLKSASPVRRSPRLSTDSPSLQPPLDLGGSSRTGFPASKAPTSSGTAPGMFLPRIMEVLPDLDLSWAVKQLQEQISMASSDPLAAVLEHALELQGGYPKTALTRPLPPQLYDKSYEDATYRRIKRFGTVYYSKSLFALQDYFPRIPVPFIKTTFFATHSLYYPTFLSLKAKKPNSADSYQELKRPRPKRQKATFDKGKGRASLTVTSESEMDPLYPLEGDQGASEWESEDAYLCQQLARERTRAWEEEAKNTARELAFTQGCEIECACCFGDELIDEMFQCAEGHLFCRECCTKHAESKLGQQVTAIGCMDSLGCSAPFTDTELTRCLSSKSLKLFHRLKQAEELAAAGLDNLETCPACPYATIIENDAEKLFKCLNDECLRVSCRRCRSPAKIMRGKPAGEETRQTPHHRENAMSDALIRRCPQCSNPYLKDSGCNKISCTKCRTVSCYVCQKAIPEGHAHFDQSPSTSVGRPKQSTKCRLWDGEANLAAQDARKIIAAGDSTRQRILQSAKDEGMQITDEELQVDISGSQKVQQNDIGPGQAGLHLRITQANRLSALVAR